MPTRKEVDMSEKVRAWSTAFLAGIVTGSVAALFLASHPDKSARARVSHLHAADHADLDDWSRRVAMGSGESADGLPPAPMGWY